MNFFTIFFLVIVAIVVLSVIKGIYVVRQQETVVVERLGRFHRLFESGLSVLIPFIDQPRHLQWVRNGIVVNTDRIDMRESVLDIPEQRVITKDNVGITVDAIIFMQLLDPKRAAYEIQSLPLAVAQLTQTTLRNLIGEMELDATLSSRDAINTRLKSVLDEATDKWGLKVTRVELKNINPPIDVQQAMEKQMQAERGRRAHVLEAEGLKQAKVLEAEGEKRSRIERSEGEQQEKINQALGDRDALISRAEGQARSIEAVASAQAKAIDMVRTAFGDPAVAANYLVAMEYLKRFAEFGAKPTDKVFIPYEASASLGSLGGIRELFNDASHGAHGASSNARGGAPRA
jgi:regulator of protease activity HflC (stomatin/prohibitin superfamily)